jgi:hypothetical protein
LLPGQTNDRFGNFELTYTSYGYSYVNTVGRQDSLGAHDQHQIETFFYFGIPTTVTDVPRSGTASYTGISEGRLYDLTSEYQLKGTATLNADFASGDIETTLLLSGMNATDGSTVNLGTFDGVAKLPSDANSFRGTWVASSTGYVGSILGNFFGPAAAEFGYTFGINKPDL